MPQKMLPDFPNGVSIKSKATKLIFRSGAAILKENQENQQQFVRI
jgi:hypothetical protein